MAEENKGLNTYLSIWTNSMTGLITQDFETNGVDFDEYSKKCAMGAMQNVYQLVTQSGEDINKISRDGLREIVGNCASLKLNSNAVPKEVFFNLRNKKVGDNWVKQVEMGLTTNGYLAMLRNFGVNVVTVYDAWLVKEHDEFTYPKRKGLEITAPEWSPMGKSTKTIRAVVPVKLTDGSVTYLIAERDGVMINLIAHIKQNLLNETFGICKDRYKATDAEKKQIAEKKTVILNAVKACKTLDEMLACPEAQPYIMGAWSDTTESMIETKLVGNAIRKYQKDFNSMANRSLVSLDETYRESQEEIEENANSEPFIVDDVIAEGEANANA